MPPVAVTPVGSKKDLDAFIKFPWRIYRNDPAWVPPLILERREFYNRSRHPFYQHGDAQLFLARRGSEIAGRIMASDDPHYNEVHASNAGCFGSFESVDDAEVASALFDRAGQWLRERGRSEVLGPIDYSTNYYCGLLIEGHQHPPTLLTNHNPPYYQVLWEGGGFTKTIDFWAWWFSEGNEPAERLRKLAEAMKKRHRISIRPVNMRDFAAEAERIRNIYNQAWEKNWGYVPFTHAEFDHMAREIKPILVPEAALIAEVDGVPAGFVLAAPDINVALKKINGRLTTFGLPIGLLKLIYHKRQIRTGRLIALGVLEKFRRHGLAEMLTLQMIDYAVQKRGFTGELGLTLEDNMMVNRFIEAMGATKYKTYRIYQRALT